MPLPLLLLGGALVAGGIGVKKGIDAVSDTNRASELNADAQDVFDKAAKALEKSKAAAATKLEELGKAKLSAWNDQMSGFVKLFGQLKNVELQGGDTLQENLVQMTNDELQEIRSIALQATEVIGGGVATLGAGALAGFGAYGGATMFAAASTGTAISSLSGVAATNATLAWFGGGALSAGGLGMAGGMAVLGGIVAGPALLIGGAVLSAKAKEKLAAARSNYAQATAAAEEMKVVTTALKGIERIAEQFTDFIDDLCPRFDDALEGLESVIRRRGADYSKFSDAERQKVYVAVEFAHLVKKVLETPLLSEDGAMKRGLGRRLESYRSIALELQRA